MARNNAARIALTSRRVTTRAQGIRPASLAAGRIPALRSRLFCENMFPVKIDNFKLLIEAGNPIISMETPDETRAIRLVREVAEANRLPLVQWSVTDGLQMKRRRATKRWSSRGSSPPRWLWVTRQSSYPVLYFFKDLGRIANAQGSARSATSIFRRTAAWTMIIVEGACLAAQGPADDGAVRSRLARRGELWRSSARLSGEKRSQPATGEIEAHEGEMELQLQTLRGLTTEEAAGSIAGAIYETTYSTAPTCHGSWKPTEAAGLGRLPRSDRCRRRAGRNRRARESEGMVQMQHARFLARRREFGIDPPRGMLLLGVQGCGKSLCARSSPRPGGCRLLRMDPGALYQKYIGESEAGSAGAPPGRIDGAGHPVDR